MKKISFQFEEVITKDKVELQGVIAGPAKAKYALILIHGLTSNFYNNVARLNGIAQACLEKGIAFYAFNNRGHDEVNEVYPVGKKKGYLAGGWFEKFTDCVYDIQAVIDLAKQRGAFEIYLAGHSTGANKIIYYLATKQDRRVAGLALISGLSDVSAYQMELGWKFKPALRLAQAAAQRWPNKPIAPKFLGGKLISAQRVVSLLTPGGTEDVFPYHKLGGKWTLFQRVKQPMLILIGDKDQYLHLSAKEYIETLTSKSRSRKLRTHILGGATHNFTEHASQLGKMIASWVLTAEK